MISLGYGLVYDGALCLDMYTRVPLLPWGLEKECVIVQEGIVTGRLNMQYPINICQSHESHLPCNCSNLSTKFVSNIVVVKAK